MECIVNLTVSQLITSDPPPLCHDHHACQITIDIISIFFLVLIDMSIVPYLYKLRRHTI